MLSATNIPVLPEKYIKKQEQPNFRPAAPAIKGRIESRKQEHVGGSYAFHGFYNTGEL